MNKKNHANRKFTHIPSFEHKDIYETEIIDGFIVKTKVTKEEMLKNMEREKFKKDKKEVNVNPFIYGGGGGGVVIPPPVVNPVYALHYELPSDGHKIPVLNQGHYDTCVSNVMVDAMRICYYRNTTGKVKDFSRQWIYGNRLATDTQGEGMQVYQALNKMINDGVPLKNDLITLANGIGDVTIQDYLNSLASEQHEYTAVGEQGLVDYYDGDVSWVEPILPSTDEVLITAKQIVEGAYSAVMNSGINYKITNSWGSSLTTSSMKNNLVQYSPLIISLSGNNANYASYLLEDAILDKDYTSMPPQRIDGGYFGSDGWVTLSEGYHCVTIVGWCQKTFKGVLTECWKVKNSWGTDNYGSGFFYIPTAIFSTVVAGYPSIFEFTSKSSEFKKSNYSTSVKTASSYTVGRPVANVITCDLINCLGYYLNAKRQSKGLSLITAEWVADSDFISATMFNQFRAGYIAYKTACGESTTLSSLPIKATNDAVKGSEIWTLYNTIENNL